MNSNQFSMVFAIVFMLITINSIQMKPIKNRRDLIVNPYNTWGDYCRMKDPFHPKCRGIAVQKLIELSIEQMEPTDENDREKYREFLLGYVLEKYPNILEKLLNHNKFLRQMIMYQLENSDKQTIQEQSTTIKTIDYEQQLSSLMNRNIDTIVFDR